MPAFGVVLMRQRRSSLKVAIFASFSAILTTVLEKVGFAAAAEIFASTLSRHSSDTSKTSTTKNRAVVYGIKNIQLQGPPQGWSETLELRAKKYENM